MSDATVKVYQRGPKTISLTFPSGVRASIRGEVALKDVLALLEDTTSNTSSRTMLLNAPVPL